MLFHKDTLNKFLPYPFCMVGRISMVQSLLFLLGPPEKGYQGSSKGLLGSDPFKKKIKYPHKKHLGKFQTAPVNFDFGAYLLTVLSLGKS